MLIPLSFLAALAFVQDPAPPPEPPLLTLKNELTFRLFMEKLEAHGWGSIWGDDVEVRKFQVDVKDAGFCRALDEICRRHGQVTYFHPESLERRGREYRIKPAPWIDYPTSYHGHYKVIASHVLHTRQRTADGDRDWTNLRLVLFGPPWAQINWMGNSNPTWTLESVQSADGRDLRTGFREYERLSTHDVRGEDDDREGNILSISMTLKSPGADPTLKAVRGKVDVEVAALGVKRLDFKAGAGADLGEATISIVGIDSGKGTWAVRCVAQRKASAGKKRLWDILDRTWRSSEDTAWDTYSLDQDDREQGDSFDLEVQADAEPMWIEFRYFEHRRRVVIPFSFETIRFAP